MSRQTSSPRIAISFGASFLGYATHAGFMSRLHELGVRPVSVGGSSSGAIAAGLYASGLDQAKMKEVVLSWPFRYSFIQKTPWFMQHLRCLTKDYDIGFFSSHAAVSHLEKIIGTHRIEDLKAPRFLAAACELEARKTHYLQQGNLAEAMVASACVPALFSPLSFGGTKLFDGGIANEVPIDPWLTDPEVDIIVAHRVTHMNRYTSGPRFFPFNVIKLSMLSRSSACEQLLAYQLQLAALHGKKMLLSTTVHPRPALFSGQKMPDYYEAGVEEAERFFEQELQPLMNNFSGKLPRVPSAASPELYNNRQQAS